MKIDFNTMEMEEELKEGRNSVTVEGLEDTITNSGKEAYILVYNACGTKIKSYYMKNSPVAMKILYNDLCALLSYYHQTNVDDIKKRYAGTMEGIDSIVIGIKPSVEVIKDGNFHKIKKIYAWQKEDLSDVPF
jgi:hypothetical protein